MTTAMDVADMPDAATSLSRPELWRSITRLQRWVEDHDYRGYEPFDGLCSWARPVAWGSLLAERLLLQSIRQCPFNLRPLLGVRPQESTKGRGYMALGYLFLYRASNERSFLEKARACLQWLDTQKVRRFHHHSWSNHYDFVSRGGSYTKDDPIIVWTALIGHAYLEAYEITGEEWFLSIAQSACNWILELPRERTGQGDCLSYLAHVQSSIHNANMLGASLLARAARHNSSRIYLDVARAAMKYSCACQRSDGSWWYAEDPKYHWIDNFHTGYNLDSLDMYIASTGDDHWASNLQRGLSFYKSHFFEETGRPRYYHTRTYPVDVQCIAQSIETLARFASRDSECARLVEKVAAWAIRNMQSAKGYFYYRQYPLMKAKTPMLHWGQATMFKGLAQLRLHLQSHISNCIYVDK